MNKWRAINTAPKDRDILIAFPDKRVVIGIITEESYPMCICSVTLDWMSGAIAWQELPVFDGVIAE